MKESMDELVERFWDSAQEAVNLGKEDQVFPPDILSKMGLIKTQQKLEKIPPNAPIKSTQYDLFTEYLTNNISEVSNTIDLWERIPKYFLSPQEQKSLRTIDGLANPFVHEYTLRDENGAIVPFKIKIQPALILQPDGSYKAFFLSNAEEAVEDVLKKIFSEQTLGIHDEKNSENWVKFSYSMIRKELKKNGCSRTFESIKHSLEIMSSCVLTVFEDEKEIYTGAILQDYLSVDRSAYLEDTKDLHVARLPIFISRAINTLQYRQYNYKRLMLCKEGLSKWLLRRLINNFIYAALLTDHHFLFSTIKAESGLLRAKKESKNREKLISALDELVETGAIDNKYVVEEILKGRKVSDVKYTVKATPEFIKEQKAANKRKKEAKLKIK